MRVISIKRIFSLIWEKRGIFFLIIISCILLGTLNSARTYKSVVTEAEKAAIEYEKDLEKQDEAIADLKENLTSLSEKYEDQKEYCDDSIYMKLDASEIWYAEIQYAYTSEVNTGYTMNALAAYYDSVEMRRKIEESTGFDERYLKEILFYSFMGNVTRYSIYMPDEESASKVLECIKTELNKAQNQIEAIQGKYTAAIESEEIGTRADLSVLSNQNSIINTLNSLKSNLTDTKSLIEAKQLERDSCARVYPMSMFEKILHFVKGIVLGLAIGIVVSILLSVIKILFGRRILDEECLRGRGIHILPISGKSETHIDAAGEDIFLCASMNSINRIIVLMVSVDEAICEGALSHLLLDKGIKMEFVKYKADRKEILAKIGACEGAIVYLQKGLSLYKDLDDVCDRLDRYGVQLLGGLYDEDGASGNR